MTFAFCPDDPSVQAGLRRIARAELGAALSALDGPPPGPAQVHQLRKHLKKTRGLLRLVRPVFPGFAAVDGALRTGARHLADLRDAEVRLATLRTLLADLPGGLAEGQARAALDTLSVQVDALRAPDAMQVRTRALTATLRDLRRGARQWRLDAGGWAALEPGLARTWRAARRGLIAAGRAHARGGPPEAFHDWRRTVKHHWYQARLLAPVWSAMLAPQIAATDALAEDLGALHDLDVLIAHLSAQTDPAVAALALDGPLARAAAAARADLAARSLRQGQRLLADRPGALTRRWGIWWHDWCREVCQPGGQDDGQDDGQDGRANP